MRIRGGTQKKMKRKFNLLEGLSVRLDFEGHLDFASPFSGDRSLGQKKIPTRTSNNLVRR